MNKDIFKKQQPKKKNPAMPPSSPLLAHDQKHKYFLDKIKTYIKTNYIKKKTGCYTIRTIQITE